MDDKAAPLSDVAGFRTSFDGVERCRGKDKDESLKSIEHR